MKQALVALVLSGCAPTLKLERVGDAPPIHSVAVETLDTSTTIGRRGSVTRAGLGLLLATGCLRAVVERGITPIEPATRFPADARIRGSLVAGYRSGRLERIDLTLLSALGRAVASVSLSSIDAGEPVTVGRAMCLALLRGS